MPPSTVRAPLSPCNPLPFAAVPHALLRDPRLTTRAVVTAAALLEYARSGPSCCPSNASLASDMGCSVGTARNGLASLLRAGWIAIEAGAANPTGRLIRLAWREAEAAAGPRIAYADYLQTPHWKDCRGRAIERSGGACQVCNASRGLDVHHRTYDRLGAEADTDLIVLCRPCHGLFHDHGKLVRVADVSSRDVAPEGNGKAPGA